MNGIKTYTAIAAVAAALVLIASACGGGGDSNAGDATPTSPGGTEQVSVSDVDGVGDVLVDAEGVALYTSDQEADGMVLCTESCLAFWDPLTLPAGADAPTGDAAFDGMLGTTERPDGAQQVTLGGKPLYRFTDDTGPGVVSGDGVADSFDGQEFTWQVATPTGASTPGPSSPGGGLGY